LLRSYKYYSRNYRCAPGNWLSHQSPGLYAAPRTIGRGEKLTKLDLIQALRVPVTWIPNGNVWSGSFRGTNSTIEISPAAINGNQPAVVTVLFKDNREIERYLPTIFRSKHSPLRLKYSPTIFRRKQANPII